MVYKAKIGTQEKGAIIVDITTNEDLDRLRHSLIKVCESALDNELVKDDVQQVMSFLLSEMSSSLQDDNFRLVSNKEIN